MFYSFWFYFKFNNYLENEIKYNVLKLLKLIYYNKNAGSDGVIKIRIIHFAYILVFSCALFISNESVNLIENIIWNK